MSAARCIAAVCFFFPLLCIAAPIQPLSVPSEGKTGFAPMLPAQTGLVFTNLLSDDRSSTNRNLLSGSGVAAGDIDGDGNIDLFFCALDSANVLYRNLGNWRFQDITSSSPDIACLGWDSTGAAFADVDGDADLDLFINALGRGTRLFLNDGKGRFTPATSSGLQTHTGSTSLALADIDGDSDLDLYVTNFRPTTIRDDPSTRFTIDRVGDRLLVTRVNGRPTTAPDLTNRFTVAASGTVLEFGELDTLYENDGSGRFTPVPFSSGRFRDHTGAIPSDLPFDWGLAAQLRDINGDGAPDLYVCNDYWTPDRIWINDGAGNFSAPSPFAVRSTSLSSMGVDFADINRDGHPDFIVVDMLARHHRDRHIQVGDLQPYISTPGAFLNPIQVAQNTLQLNRGDATFAQISDLSGLYASEWSWSPIFLDVDLDGWEDLFVSNGHRRDFQNADATVAIQEALAAGRLSSSSRREILETYPLLLTPNLAFRNNRDLTFTETASDWGLATSGISHGVCLADLDNDGDLDIVMNNLGAVCGIYRNDAIAPRVSVRLVGEGKNTSGIGAMITLRTSDLTQSQEMISGGRYLSSDAPERVFALPSAGKATLEVKWRDGRITRIDEIRPNHRYTIHHPAKARP